MGGAVTSPSTFGCWCLASLQGLDRQHCPQKLSLKLSSGWTCLPGCWAGDMADQCLYAGGIPGLPGCLRPSLGGSWVIALLHKLSCLRGRLPFLSCLIVPESLEVALMLHSRFPLDFWRVPISRTAATFVVWEKSVSPLDATRPPGRTAFSKPLWVCSDPAFHQSLKFAACPVFESH